jgi:hypothetical protein
MEALLKVTDAVRSIKVRPYFAKQEGALSNQKTVTGNKAVWLAASD